MKSIIDRIKTLFKKKEKVSEVKTTSAQASTFVQRGTFDPSTSILDYAQGRTCFGISRGGKTRWSSFIARHSLEMAKDHVSKGNDPQEIIDEQIWSEEAKEWASDYIRARDLANKLDGELQGKTTTKTGGIKI
ncbi:hypothetical protein [Burkholderia cenocepacia]|uniref:hypothetical protein n=1 Tax=Burkholderia cenocepacia TaxID=95486 RepID=UPI001177EA59|nr:hypothetical protein [Burkholderia cenocepacia]